MICGHGMEIIMGKEIERKFITDPGQIPGGLSSYPYHEIEQGYLNAANYIVRVRRSDDTYYMTYKGPAIASASDKGAMAGGLACEEYNLDLDRAGYEHLLEKADGIIIYKKRYIIPLNTDAFDEDYLKDHPDIRSMLDEGEIKIELDVFEREYQGRVVAEVEFPDEETALIYNPAKWFGREVTKDPDYSNAHMSKG